MVKPERSALKQPGGTGKLLSLLTADGGMSLLLLAICVLYMAGPLLVYYALLPREEYLQLAQLTAVAVVGMWMGSRLSFMDRRVSGRAPRLVVDSNSYIHVVTNLFLAYIVITLVTAPSIPLISALAGSDANSLSVERGEFLKGRDGPWVALLYLSTIFTSTLVPYCIVLAYSCNSRYRHWLALVFLFFAICFLVKALFLNLLIPVLAYAVEKGKLKASHFWYAIGGAVGLLLVMISLSGFGDTGGGSIFSFEDFFSVSFASGSASQFLIYRSVAVPIFTAADTLTVHATQFGGNLLMGATSSLVAALTGQERINIERFVFEYQFGGWNDFANSNVVFLVDAFVNFGWVGVLVISGIVGLTFRMFRISPDPAFRSLASLYAFLLVSSPFIGMFLSNGFLLLFAQMLFVKVKVHGK